MTEAELVPEAAGVAHAGALNALIHPPLYFVGAHVWADVFGNSVRTLRTFLALLSLLALPFMYWLCRELFDSPLAAWLGVTLFSCNKNTRCGASFRMYPNSGWLGGP